MDLSRNQQAVEAVHELVASLLKDGVSQREIAVACRVDPERLDRWMERMEREVAARRARACTETCLYLTDALPLEHLAKKYSLCNVRIRRLMAQAVM